MPVCSAHAVRTPVCTATTQTRVLAFFHSPLGLLGGKWVQFLPPNVKLNVASLACGANKSTVTSTIEDGILGGSNSAAQSSILQTPVVQIQKTTPPHSTLSVTPAPTATIVPSAQTGSTDPLHGSRDKSALFVTGKFQPPFIILSPFDKNWHKNCAVRIGCCKNPPGIVCPQTPHPEVVQPASSAVVWRAFVD